VRLLLDEHLAPRIADQLRQLGHDVVAVVERADLHRATDDPLWAVASPERRVIVTQDVADFMRLASQDAAIGKPHPGLILVHHRRFSRGTRDIGRLVASLGSMLAAAPADDALAGRVVWLPVEAE